MVEVWLCRRGVLWAGIDGEASLAEGEQEVEGFEKMVLGSIGLDLVKKDMFFWFPRKWERTSSRALRWRDLRSRLWNAWGDQARGYASWAYRTPCDTSTTGPICSEDSSPCALWAKQYSVPGILDERASCAVDCRRSRPAPRDFERPFTIPGPTRPVEPTHLPITSETPYPWSSADQAPRSRTAKAMHHHGRGPAATETRHTAPPCSYHP